MRRYEINMLDIAALRETESCAGEMKLWSLALVDNPSEEAKHWLAAFAIQTNNRFLVFFNEEELLSELEECAALHMQTFPTAKMPAAPNDVLPEPFQSPNWQCIANISGPVRLSILQDALEQHTTWKDERPTTIASIRVCTGLAIECSAETFILHAVEPVWHLEMHSSLDELMTIEEAWSCHYTPADMLGEEDSDIILKNCQRSLIPV